MKTQEIKNLYAEYILPTYTQLPVCVVKGKGSLVWDMEGNQYLDFFPGWGVSALGHCPPAVVNALKHQARKILHISNNFLNLKQAQLAKEIAEHSFPARTFFCNSGAEASEAAIKFARKYGAAEGRFEIITMKKSFHGRTLGAMTATGQEKVWEGFAPLPAGFQYAEMNRLVSVEKLINEKTVAIFLECVQGEGGIHVATDDFMKGLRALADERDLLLIVDEVQTGMGRTGKMFGFQHYGIEPDLMTLAKALGGGVPIGALVANRRVTKEVFTPGSHGSTYGGNPLAVAAGLAVFKSIKKEKLLRHTVEMGDYLAGKLQALKSKFPVIAESRGLGLMRALELKEAGAGVVDSARQRGLLINCTQGNILRIMPAMTVTKGLIDRAADILEKAFEESFFNARG